MTWTKLSDDFADDCCTLSDVAFRLHVEGLTWSNRKLLDCRIPAAHLRRFATHPEAVAELLATGWWTVDGDAYLVRHHATYQRLREQVVAQQEANAKNGKKGGRPPKPREQAGTDLLTDSVSKSPSERDGPGQGCAGEVSTDLLASHDNAADGSWSDVTVAVPGAAPLCELCRLQLDGAAQLLGTATCTTCEQQQARNAVPGASPLCEATS